MTVSRKTIRDGLAGPTGILTTALSSMVGEVVPYRPSVLNATPGVYIRSISADRPPLTVVGKFTKFIVAVLIIVRQSDTTATPAWTEAKADDLLDDIEATICATLSANKSLTGVWNTVEYDKPSQVDHFLEQGIPYIMEAIFLRVEVTRE